MTYEKVLKQLAKNIKALRKEEGWTQMDMVKKGFDYRHYQALESGKHSPSLTTLHRLAKTFGVSMQELLKSC